MKVEIHWQKSWALAITTAKGWNPPSFLGRLWASVQMQMWHLDTSREKLAVLLQPAHGNSKIGLQWLHHVDRREAV